MTTWRFPWASSRILWCWSNMDWTSSGRWALMEPYKAKIMYINNIILSFAHFVCQHNWYNISNMIKANIQVNDRRHTHTGICNPQSKHCRWSRHISRKLHQQPAIWIKNTTLEWPSFSKVGSKKISFKTDIFSLKMWFGIIPFHWLCFSDQNVSRGLWEDYMSDFHPQWDSILLPCVQLQLWFRHRHQEDYPNETNHSQR